MAEADDTGQDRVHDATPRRIEQAREKGDMPRSQDAQSFAAYLGLAVALVLGGTWSARQIGDALTALLAHPFAVAADLLGEGRGATLPDIALGVIVGALPAVALPAALIVALLIAKRGVVLASDKIAPKFSRISPMANAKQKFGPSGLVEFAKSVVKVSAVALVLYIALAAELDDMAAAALLSPRQIGWILGEQLEAILIGVLITAAAIAAIDLAWQNHEFLRRNRMTHQDLKEESKQMEGDPHLKAERKARARDAAQNRMLLDVPKADVVIANPTHYAVALKWDRAAGSAPKCLAKGVDEIALRIREIAEREGVPVQEDPATARSVYALVEIGQEVAPEHYRAVAAAILFADRMREKARGAGRAA